MLVAVFRLLRRVALIVDRHRQALPPKKPFTRLTGLRPRGRRLVNDHSTTIRSQARVKSWTELSPRRKREDRPIVRTDAATQPPASCSQVSHRLFSFHLLPEQTGIRSCCVAFFYRFRIASQDGWRLGEHLNMGGGNHPVVGERDCLTVAEISGDYV